MSPLLFPRLKAISFRWIAALLLIVAPMEAAVTAVWTNRYNNPNAGSDDRPKKIVRDSAGDVIVAGYTDEWKDSSDDGPIGRDALAIKYSGLDGSVIWQRRVDGPAGNNDEFRAAAVDAQNNVIAGGISQNANFLEDFYTAKYAATDGALIWEQRYTGSGRDHLQALAVDGQGDVIVTGYSWAGTNYDGVTIKYSGTNGDVLWKTNYHGPAGDLNIPMALALDAAGNAVVAGYSRGIGTSDDYFTVKYSAIDGSVLWEQRYDGPVGGRDRANGVAVDGSSNVVVTGRSTANGYYDCYTVKYAGGDGAFLWERRYAGPAGDDDAANSVALDSEGNAIITGFTYKTNGYSDFYTAKYAATNGALLWEQLYNGPADDDDSGGVIALDSAGNAIVTGYFHSLAGAIGFHTVKYAATNGAVLWEKDFTNSVATPAAIAVAENDDVFVTGFALNAATYADFYTARYSAGNGATLWSAAYAGDGNNTDTPVGVAIDHAGDVIVSGYSYGPFQTYNLAYYTAKYSGTNGALLWERRFDEPGYEDDEVGALALDADGNVIVSGQTEGGLYTAKYASTNGAVLWERRYLGGGSYFNGLRAVTVDAQGNVVVTGYFKDDYYTAKYAGVDGAILWEKLHTRAEFSLDRANAVALDSAGNVIVTGTSANDFCTVKYAAGNGAVLWERYDSGTNALYDRFPVIAVDRDDNVVVSGYSDWGILTFKYAVANGAPIWQRYHNQALGISYPSAIAVDLSNNVVIAGTSFGDYYTAKYAAANGAVLWESYYNGLHSGTDEAAAMKLDDIGDVIVTGTSYLEASSFDYCTVKYSGSDGALLWEKRYDGPAHFRDTPAGLALGPNGAIAVTGYSDAKTGFGLWDYLTILYRETLPPISIKRTPSGPSLHFTGIPGRRYRIESAPGVSGPWESVATVTAPASGLNEYTNSASSTVFYRTVAAP